MNPNILRYITLSILTIFTLSSLKLKAQDSLFNSKKYYHGFHSSLGIVFGGSSGNISYNYQTSDGFQLNATHWARIAPFSIVYAFGFERSRPLRNMQFLHHEWSIIGSLNNVLQIEYLIGASQNIDFRMFPKKKNPVRKQKLFARPLIFSPEVSMN